MTPAELYAFTWDGMHRCVVGTWDAERAKGVANRHPTVATHITLIANTAGLLLAKTALVRRRLRYRLAETAHAPVVLFKRIKVLQCAISVASQECQIENK